MSNQNSSSSGGVSTIGLLGVVFVVLKLIGVINWSWWWVTLPFWGGIAIMLMAIPIYILYLKWKHKQEMKLEEKKFEKKIEKAFKSKFAQRLEDAMRQAENSKSN